MGFPQATTSVIRNPIYNKDGGIDCEVDHPDFGWIPFTASDSDAEAHGRDIYQVASGLSVAPYVPPAPTSTDVNQERNLRVLAGKDFSVTGYATPISVKGDETTQTNLMALGMAAQARMAQGDLLSLTPYRDENNTIHQLTPPQMFELWSLGAAYVSEVYQASWAIKDDAAGLPADIPGDTRWPS